MMAIPREAGRITYSTKIREMKKISLSEFQNAVLIGSVLGDACLHGNWSKTNYRLQIRHSKDQEEYMTWKYDIFKDIVLTPPQYYRTTNSIWFRTVSHPDITKLYKLFYPNGKKLIPRKEIENWLANPLTLAVWFMDDGNARKYAGRITAFHLNTQSFSHEENEFLIQSMRKIWQIECVQHSNHEYTRLYIGAKSSSKFNEIIRPYVLPSMKYKIGYIGDSP